MVPKKYDADKADAMTALAEAKAATAREAKAATARTEQMIAQMSPLKGEQVLNECRDHLTRFVIYPSPEAADVTVLWIAATHIHQSFDTLGRLGFLSDKPASGKTRAMQVMAPLCARPREELDPTGPALASLINETHCTVFIDETDTIWGKSGSDASNRKLRAILNSGYKKGSKLTRRSGNNSVSEEVFSPVCFAGLGSLPHTITTRTLCIRMVPRRPGQKAEIYYPRMHSPIGAALGKALAEWTATIADLAGSHWPESPPGIADRNLEVCEALLTIADFAGGHWPVTARNAVRYILLEQAENSGPTPAQALLQDIRSIWPRKMPALHSATLCEALTRDQAMPWGALWSPGSEQRELSALLRSLSPAIMPVKVKVGGEAKQGYRFTSFAAHWLAIDQSEAIETDALNASDDDESDDDE